MSKYKQIQTEFRNPVSLQKALEDVFGVGSVSTSKSIQDFYRNSQDVDLSVSRNVLTGRIQHALFGDLGFKQNASGVFDAVVDHLDETSPGYAEMFNQVKQRYAYHEVYSLATARGYSVQETPDSSGVIRLKLVQY